ncbi:unnamed protein product [Rotaria sp. Silwood1]|nr:unnamed protein product [Rotaria sp. Silwood1]
MKVSQSAKINVQHVHVTRKARSASNSIRDSVQKPVEDNSNLRPASIIFSHASEENPMKQESTLTTPFTTVTTVQEGKPCPLSLSESTINGNSNSIDGLRTVKLLRLPLQAQRQQQRQQRQQRQQQQQQLPLQQRLQQPLQQRLRQPLQQPLQPPLQQRLQQPLQQPLQQQRRQQRLQQQLQQRLPPSLQQPLQQRLQQPLQQRLQQPLQQRL